MARENKGVAWYDISGSGWVRDFWVLMHWPYSIWHLSYVLIGAAMAPVMNWPLLGWTYLAFFLGMGIGGHCLDELNGRPLKTTLHDGLLWFLTGIGVGGALAIGLIIGDRETMWVLPCIVFGGFIVFAYNLEWPVNSIVIPKGFFHRDIWFGMAWGAFPTITAYVAQTHTFSWEAAIVALFALLSSMAQRKLSLQSRFWRRKVTFISGNYWLEFGGMGEYARTITKGTIIAPVDLALKYLNGAIIAVAVGLLLMRL